MPGFTAPLPAGFAATKDAYADWAVGQAEALFAVHGPIDIVGHEVSHGVTSNTAGLIYSSESGGLNEATSDIFGAMIEYYANNEKQPPNYVIGEQIFTVPAWNKFIRTMFKPNLDGI